MAPSKPGESVLDGVIAVCNVDDAEAFLKHYQPSLEQFAEFYRTLNDLPAKFEGVKKLEIDGHVR